jgi:superfamily II DNA or RNA helicase
MSSAGDRLLALLDGLTGSAFEHLVKWWLTADPVYAAQIRRVWLWDEWQGRWGPDCGIDLVAEGRDGLWAIQTKAYAAAATVTKAGVDSFLSESSRAIFTFRLLVATTDRIAPNAQRAIAGQEKRVGIVRRRDLEASAVTWPRSVEQVDLAGPRRARRPYRHQTAAIRAVTGGLLTHDRGQLVMACGIGKTLTGLWIAERLRATRTLVLVPSLSLLEQTLREWLANAAEAFPYLAVCSDETVAVDEPITRAADLGVPVTTDPERVRSFLRARGRRVVFSTYQSSAVIVAAQDAVRIPHFDLAVADEAHRCAGAVGSDFALVLDEKRIRARKRLFMTATPRYFSGRIRREALEADLELASMDDEVTFGPVLHRLDFAEAIQRGLLSDYRVLVSAVDQPTFAHMVAQAELVRVDGIAKTDARTLARQVTLLRAIRRYGLRRVLTFHGRVDAARRFASDLPQVRAWLPSGRPGGSLWASWVSGDMNVADRQIRLNRLRDLGDAERAVVSNARCLAEGLDVPAIDGVAFIDPRRSQVDIIQAVGRAIRRSEGKTTGTIIVPVVVAPDDDPEAVLASSEFCHVWDVVNALRAHDPALGEELDELRRRLGREGGAAHRPGRLVLDLPSKLGRDFADAVRTRLVEQTTASWEFWLGLLEAFVEREGHARVPVAHRENGFKLGGWINGQRTERERNHLRPEREARLAAVAGWVWDARETQWEEAYAALRVYVDREGHARVPPAHVEGDIQLGRWVLNIRRRRWRLSSEREARLEALPGWAWDARNAIWEQSYAALRTYVEREGHARVPNRHIEGDVNLGRWVGKQRRSRPCRDREMRLAALPGWEWDPFDAVWEEKFALLEVYVEREGDARVPRGRIENGSNLGRWVIHQRTLRHELTEARRTRLEALPGWVWHTGNARWEDGYTALVAFANREGHARVPAQHVEGDFKLGRWVNKQRSRRTSLSSDRRQRLNTVAGWVWSAVDAQWEDAFARLQNHIVEDGDGRVPREHITPDGYRLGYWVNNQRGRRRRLKNQRKVRLESLPGWTWTVGAASTPRGHRDTNAPSQRPPVRARV